MDLTLLLSVGLLVYLACALDLLGFLARDELWLRTLMLAGSALYLIYYFTVADEPLWDAFYTNAALGLVNLIMIGIVLRERSTRAMSAAAVRLYQFFPRMSPGHFRKLMEIGTRRQCFDAETVIFESKRLDALFFVISGDVTISKGGTAKSLPADGVFFGEIAFLTGVPASATVTFSAGADYVVWPSEDLQRLSYRVPDLGNALTAHLSEDLARKVAGSLPVEP